MDIGKKSGMDETNRWKVRNRQTDGTDSERVGPAGSAGWALY